MFCFKFMLSQMRNNFYILICGALFVVFSCKKEKMTNTINNTTVAIDSSLIDNIRYVNIVPNFTLQSGVLRDTVFNYFLDIDSDKINDYNFSLERVKYMSCGNPITYVYRNRITVSSVDTSNYLTSVINYTCNGPNYCLPRTSLVDSSNIIDNSVYLFNSHNQLLYTDVGFDRVTFEGRKYLPIKLKNMNYGWIAIEGFSMGYGKIVISGFAYNKTPNRSINAGHIN